MSVGATCHHSPGGWIPFASRRYQVLFLKGPPAKEPAILTEHGASINASEESKLTEDRPASCLVSLGIHRKNSTPTLSASVHGPVLQMPCGTLLWGRMVASDVTGRSSSLGWRWWCTGTDCTEEIVEVPFLVVSKTRLDGALCNLASWKMPLPMAGELKWGNL